MTETQLEEAMEPLGGILESFKEISEKGSGEFILYPVHVSALFWIPFVMGFDQILIILPYLMLVLVTMRLRRIKTYNAIKILSEDISNTSFEDRITLKETVEKVKSIINSICPSPWLGVILGISFIPALFSKTVDTIIVNYKTKLPLFNDVSSLYFIYALTITVAVGILFSYGNIYYLKTKFEKPLAELDSLLRL